MPRLLLRRELPPLRRELDEVRRLLRLIEERRLPPLEEPLEPRERDPPQPPLLRLRLRR
ncbi:hypothetical protein GCM10027067_40460 [Pseudactinotalea suaedae]